MKKKVIIAGIVAWVIVALGAATEDKPRSYEAESATNEAGMIETTPSEQNEATEEVEAEPAEPEVVVKTETKEVSIPFKTVTRNDSTLAKGTSKVVQQGANGLKQETYEVTYTDGVETGRKLVSEKTVKAAVDKIIANGTYVAPSKPATTTPSTSCANGTYINSAGNRVCRPSTQNTGGATAICRDGTYSYSQSRRGTCSHHGGVRRWL